MIPGHIHTSPNFTIVLTVFKLGAGSSWPPAYDLIWVWVGISMGAWYSF